MYPDVPGGPYPPHPTWVNAVARATWVGGGESAESIAERTDALLGALTGIFGDRGWRTIGAGEWPDGAADQAALVRRSVPRDDHGRRYSEEGYSVRLLGRGGPAADIDVWVRAGASFPGRRQPTHEVHVDLRQNRMGGMTAERADAVCRAVVRTWAPAALDFTTMPVLRLARRGGWRIGVGYRIWLAAGVGTVEVLAPGVTAAPLAGGTLLSVPDDWAAQRVVDAMTATLAANGLDEIPHPVRRPSPPSEPGGG